MADTAWKEAVIYHLQVQTWLNMCPGAIHWYGVIHCGDERHDVQREYIGKDNLNHRTIQFADPHSVRRAAKQWFRIVAKPGDVLVESTVGICDPCRVLAAYIKPGILRKANMIWRKKESIGSWEKSPHRSQLLCDMWDRLWAKIGIKTWE